MMQATDPASLPLRDIHLPDPVSFWPLAPGWWGLLILTIVIWALIVFLIQRRRKQRSSVVYLARQELKKIESDFIQHQNKTNLVKKLSALLRRISISLFQRSDTASLTGEQWLRFLDRYSDEQAFSTGDGRILIEAPYQSYSEFDSAALIQLVANWIDQAEIDKKRQTV